MAEMEIRGRIRATLRLGAVVMAAGTALVLLTTAVASELGQIWWGLELFAHFRLVYLGTAAIAAAIALAASWRWSVLVLATALPHLYVVMAPAFDGGSGAARAYALTPSVVAPPTLETTAGRRLRLLVYNVNLDNQRIEDFIALVERERPDIIVLQEIMRRWRGALDRLPAAYRYRAMGPDPIPDNAIVSRLPIRASRIHRLPSEWLNPVEVEIDVDGTRLRVVAVHLPLPLSEVGRDFQTYYLAMLARIVRRETGPVIVAGDFNLTPWTGRFRRFLAEGGLRHAAPSSLVARTRYQPGLGAATFLSGLPIDHVAVRGLKPLGDRVGRDIGSDHRPLIVDLELVPR